MSSSREENEPGSGEVMKREEEKRMTRTTIGGAIFSRLSRVPFVNIWLRKKIDTARNVVQGEKELFKDLVEHEQSFNRLLKISTILEEDDANMEASVVSLK